MFPNNHFLDDSFAHPSEWHSTYFLAQSSRQNWNDSRLPSISWHLASHDVTLKSLHERHRAGFGVWGSPRIRSDMSLEKPWFPRIKSVLRTSKNLGGRRFAISSSSTLLSAPVPRFGGNSTMACVTLAMTAPARRRLETPSVAMVFWKHTQAAHLRHRL